MAGAAAAAGLSLEKVAAEAKCASEMVGTMGVALSVCTLPGQVTSDRLGQEKMELGLGIVCYFLFISSQVCMKSILFQCCGSCLNLILFSQHGEPGAAVVDVQPVEVVVSHVLQQILSPVCANFCFLYCAFVAVVKYKYSMLILDLLSWIRSFLDISFINLFIMFNCRRPIMFPLPAVTEWFSWLMGKAHS